MGNSSSRRRNTNFYQNAPPSQRTSSFTSHPPPPPPPPPNFVFAANAPYPYPSHQTPYYHPPPPPPPPQPSYHYYNNSGYGGRLGHQPPPPMVVAPPPPVVVAPPPTYVEHQQAKKIRNDVNVHKESIKLEVDEERLDCHLVSFTFDAVVDCSVTVFYFAKDDGDCNFTPLYADAQMQVRVPFEKGLGQKFRQPSGTGIDFGFFELDDLSKPSLREDIFPLVILAEASSPLPPTNEQLHQPRTTKTQAQITQAVIEKSSEGHFQVKVIKQILWVDGVRYELREIYGIGTSAEGGFDDTDPGKECVICMSEPKDTAVLPCRHMCLCSECAKEFRLQMNKCPICRQPIEELIEIKVNKSDE